MFQSTQYGLDIEAIPATDLMGREFIEYEYTFTVDTRVWQKGIASSPQSLGRAIGGTIQDFAERYELSSASL